MTDYLNIVLSVAIFVAGLFAVWMALACLVAIAHEITPETKWMRWPLGIGALVFFVGGVSLCIYAFVF